MNEKQINELEERIDKLLNNRYKIKEFEKHLKEIEKDYHCKLATRKFGRTILGVDVYILK